MQILRIAQKEKLSESNNLDLNKFVDRIKKLKEYILKRYENEGENKKYQYVLQKMQKQINEKMSAISEKINEIENIQKEKEKLEKQKQLLDLIEKFMNKYVVKNTAKDEIKKLLEQINELDTNKLSRIIEKFTQYM